MLKKFLLLLTLSITALSANAQMPDLEQRIKDMQERLVLTDSQSEQIRPIIEESIAARGEILKKYGIDPANKDRQSFKKLGFRDKRKLGSELKEVKKATHEKLEAILSEEQLDEYEAIQRERKEKLREQMKNHS